MYKKEEDIVVKQKTLSAIKDANGGQCTPERVVKEAADPNSPLHEDFEWDDTEAGRLYRLSQARALIVRIGFYVEKVTRNLGTVTYTKEEAIKGETAGEEEENANTKDPAIHDPDLPAKVQGYVSLEDIALRGFEAKKKTIDREFSQVEAYLKRGLNWSIDLAVTDYFIERLEAISVEYLRQARVVQKSTSTPVAP
jgi:hypothetical protein